MTDHVKMGDFVKKMGQNKDFFVNVRKNGQGMCVIHQNILVKTNLFLVEITDIRSELMGNVFAFVMMDLKDINVNWLVAVF
jgi:hypothetical protein